MRGPQLAIIADDLTGAADTAGGLAHHGMSVVLCLDRQPPCPVDVLAASADTRDAARHEVPDRVGKALAHIRSAGDPASWYHKVDSAFRGHPGLELSLISSTLAKPNVVICPALPSQLRTVVEGEILVNGVPLHETPLGEGKTTSRIDELLRDDCPAPISKIGLDVVRESQKALSNAITGGFPGIVIIDAETDDDLQAIAAALSNLPGTLPAGSAGLAAALGSQLQPQSSCMAPEPHTSSKPVLLIIGSAHEASAIQVGIASRGGMPVIRPEQLETVWSDAERDALASQVQHAVESGRDTIVTYAGCMRSPLDPHLLARQLASIAVAPIRSGSTGGLVLTGGDIAAEVCQLIDAGYIWLRGEVAPAVPWGVIGAGPAAGVPVVTKAGSFGSPTILCGSIRLIRDLSE
ncbi:MAG: four-carbon acid sugar kinase family protein [Thermomicrobiales bacterium]|nr:four-carbon acid sugar kinase family protein [Thermomicrobiales bacterium]